MDSLKWFVYWYMYVSSLTGEQRITGVTYVTRSDTVVTYVSPYQYVRFKVNYMTYNPDATSFVVVASNEYCKLFIVAEGEEIHQTLIIEKVDYTNRIILKRRRQKK